LNDYLRKYFLFAPTDNPSGAETLALAILHESKISLKGFNGEQHFEKNVNNCLNTIIALYLDTCGVQCPNVLKSPISKCIYIY
jgi:hypothetical protein